jgi:hypothetical protein
VDAIRVRSDLLKALLVECRVLHKYVLANTNIRARTEINTHKYPANIRVFNTCEYSRSNEYEYSIFASIGQVFVL